MGLLSKEYNVKCYFCRIRTVIQFWKKRDGSAAVEFALLGIPFFLIIFAILETSLIFIGDMTLEQAVARAGRSVRTGSVATSNISEAEFKAILCREINILLSCENVKFDLRSYSDFNSIPRMAPITNGILDSSGFEFEPGNAGQIMALRAFYEWPIITNIIQGLMSNLDGGRYLMSASAVFQTEPF